MAGNGNDIYLQLLEAMFEKKVEIDPSASILQLTSPLGDGDNSAEGIINKELVKSCQKLREALTISDMCVGNPFGYIEPCPIQYTGKPDKEKEETKFDCVFIGLNPHLEPCTPFPHHLSHEDPLPEDITFADLANFHHPDHIQHGCDGKKYSSEGKIKNNYWRVFGNMEPKATWSPYYQDIIRIHWALLGGEKCDSWADVENYLTSKKNEEQYKEYKEQHKEDWALLGLEECDSWAGVEKHLKSEQLSNLKKDYFTWAILKDLRTNHPIANAELIPYKSQKFTTANWSKLVMQDNEDNEDNEDNDISKHYTEYLTRLFTFINLNAKDKAYIVITTKAEDVFAMYDYLTGDYSIISKINNDISGYLFWFNKNGKAPRLSYDIPFLKIKEKELQSGIDIGKDELKKLKNKNNKLKLKETLENIKKELKAVKKEIKNNKESIQEGISKDNIPMFLLRWGHRPVVILPSISRQSPYGQVLVKLKTNDWISAIKKEFIDKLFLELA